MPYVKLRVRKNIKNKGVLSHYAPGDWVKVGRQTAEQWLASGAAELIAEQQGDAGLDATSGIILRGSMRDEWRDRLTGITGLQVVQVAPNRTPEIMFAETLIYDPRVEPRLDLILVGFKLLKKWQLAIPFLGYEPEHLAARHGSDEERQRTEDVIRDLRVPLRDTRLMFVRRCDTTRALFDEWTAAMGQGDHEQLSFLRAMYQHKPIVCDLPCEWTANNG